MCVFMSERQRFILYAANREFYTWGFDSALQKCVETPSLFRQWAAIGDTKASNLIAFFKLLSDSRPRRSWCSCSSVNSTPPSSSVMAIAAYALSFLLICPLLLSNLLSARYMLTLVGYPFLSSTPLRLCLCCSSLAEDV